MVMDVRRCSARRSRRIRGFNPHRSINVVFVCYFSLEFDYYFQCDQYFYGNCDKYCHPDPDKYNCSSDGSRVCNSGRLYKYCKQYICSAQSENLDNSGIALRKMRIPKGVLAIRRIFSLVDMITKPKF